MKRLIGTSPIHIITGSPSDPVDIIVQNLSANDVYFSFSSDPINGIKITANSYYANDSLRTSLYLIASGADSEVRIESQRGKGC